MTDRPRNHNKFYYTAVSQQEIIYNMFSMVEVIYFIHKFGKISNRYKNAKCTRGRPYIT
jgi:hypothetical protein